jgi:hypothetical protein
MWMPIAIGGLCVGAFLVVVIMTFPKRKAATVFSPRTRTVTWSIDSQGRTTIAGIPISNTNVLDAAVRAMDEFHVKSKVVVPPLTNAQLQSNFVEMLKAKRGR